MESLQWIVDHQVEIVVTVVSILLLVEGIVRALEAGAKLLLVFAGWTKTTKDDEALTGAARWLHGAADWLHAATAWLRPFSLRGTPRAPKIDAILLSGQPVDFQPGGASSPPTEGEPTKNLRTTRRDGFARIDTLVALAFWGCLALMLVMVAGVVLTGCGGGFAAMKDDACALTAVQCDVARASFERYCGPDAEPGSGAACAATALSASACVASLHLWCPEVEVGVESMAPAAYPPNPVVTVPAVPPIVREYPVGGGGA